MLSQSCRGLVALFHVWRGRSCFADHSGYRPAPGNASPPAFCLLPRRPRPHRPPWPSPSGRSTPTTPPSRTGSTTRSQRSSSPRPTSPLTNEPAASRSNVRRPVSPSRSTRGCRRRGRRTRGARRPSRSSYSVRPPVAHVPAPPPAHPHTGQAESGKSTTLKSECLLRCSSVPVPV